MSKSYWLDVYIGTPNAKAAVKSWFSPLCDDMTPESAEILCDKITDREKKLRAIMVDKDGKRRVATRTKGGKTFSVTLGAPLPAIKAEGVKAGPPSGKAASTPPPQE